MSAFIYRFSTTWDLSDLSRDLPKATFPSPSKLETSIPTFKSTHFHPLPSSYHPHTGELNLNQPTKILLPLCQQKLFLCRNLDRSPQFNRFRLFTLLSYQQGLSFPFQDLLQISTSNFGSVIVLIVFVKFSMIAAHLQNHYSTSLLLTSSYWVIFLAERRLSFFFYPLTS